MVPKLSSNPPPTINSVNPTNINAIGDSLASQYSEDAYILAAIFGLYLGISETIQRAVIPRYVPSELRGTAYGLYNAVIGTNFCCQCCVWIFMG